MFFIDAIESNLPRIAAWAITGVILSLMVITIIGPDEPASELPSLSEQSGAPEKGCLVMPDGIHVCDPDMPEEEE